MAYGRFVEHKRDFELLVGLNPEYAYVWIQLLGRGTYPTLSEGLLSSPLEKKQHCVMLQPIMLRDQS